VSAVVFVVHVGTLVWLLELSTFSLENKTDKANVHGRLVSLEPLYRVDSCLVSMRDSSTRLESVQKTLLSFVVRSVAHGHQTWFN
jgi:hypothetical protein